MKKVLLFPGIDAIDNFDTRQKCMNLPEVVARIEEAQSILNELKIPIDLTRIMVDQPKESKEWIIGLSLAALATQVGVFDRYLKEGHKVDVLLSLSLGDLSRSICAGVGSFKEVFIGLVIFANGIKPLVGKGLTYQVTSINTINSNDQLFKLEEYDISIAVNQTNHSNLYAGEMENMKNWLSYLDTLENIKYQSLSRLPLALHHKSLKELALLINKNIIQNIDINKQQYSIYSTVFNKYLTKQEDLIEEMTRNIYSSVQFCPSIKQLVETEPIEFINIGPASTLISFIKQIAPVGNPYKLKDYFGEMIHQPNC